MDFNDQTGGVISGWDHVVQSLLTILGTRLETRVFRREFGSDVPTLIDAPMNDVGILALYMAVAEAIEAWEPRFELMQVNASRQPTGEVTLLLSGNYRPNAHLGDDQSVTDDSREIRIVRDQVNSWSLAQ